jgi:hypothetical protein
MTDDEHLIGVAAVLGDVPLHPGERGRRVLDVRGMHDAGRQTVVHDGGREPRRGEALADEGLLTLVACRQRAAVERHDDRNVRTAFGQVQVQLVLVRGVVRAREVRDVADDAHRLLVRRAGGGGKRATEQREDGDGDSHGRQSLFTTSGGS